MAVTTITLDDALNASVRTLTAPAIIRGSVDLSTYPGVVTGALADSTERTANGTAMNAGVAWAASNKKFLELPPGRYEYISEEQQDSRNVGFRLPNNLAGVKFGGAGPFEGTQLIQYGTNHPILTIGDVSTDVNDLTQGKEIGGGATLAYGTDQAGQTGAVGLLLGRLWNCTLGDFSVDSYLVGMYHPYIGMQIGWNIGTFFFSNRIGMLRITGGQENIFKSVANSTGCKWSSIYCGGGTWENRVALSAAPVFIGPFGAEFGSVDQLNVEWSIPGQHYPALMCQALSLNAELVHIEGCKSYGWDVPVILSNKCALNIRTLSISDQWINPTDAQGTPCIIKIDDDNSDVRILGGTRLAWQGSDIHPEATASAAFRFVNESNATGRRTTVRTAALSIDGNTGAFSADASLTGAAPGSAGAIRGWSGYEYRKGRSTTEGAIIEMRNADLTVYAAHKSPRVKATAVLSAPRKCIISDNLAASDLGNVPVRQGGEELRFHRTAGATGAYDITVRDGADANTIGVLSTADTELIAIRDNSGAWDAS